MAPSVWGASKRRIALLECPEAAHPLPTIFFFLCFHYFGFRARDLPVIPLMVIVATPFVVVLACFVMT